MNTPSTTVHPLCYTNAFPKLFHGSEASADESSKQDPSLDILIRKIILEYVTPLGRSGFDLSISL